MPFDLDWTGDEIPDELVEPFHQANENLGRAFADEITANKWDWPSGQSPRDIRDKGNLLRSYAPERVRVGGDAAHDHNWNSDYGMAVHEGAQFSDDRPDMPARPWTDKPLQDGVLEDAFETLAQKRLGRLK